MRRLCISKRQCSHRKGVLQHSSSKPLARMAMHADIDDDNKAKRRVWCESANIRKGLWHLGMQMHPEQPSLPIPYKRHKVAATPPHCGIKRKQIAIISFRLCGLFVSLQLRTFIRSTRPPWYSYQGFTADMGRVNTRCLDILDSKQIN